MTEEKIKASFELDKELWKDFVGYSRLIHRSTASEMLRRYVEQVVRENSNGKKERKA
jgi:hypothetical protein